MKARAALNAATSPWCGMEPASNAIPAAARAGVRDERSVAIFWDG